MNQPLKKNCCRSLYMKIAIFDISTRHAKSFAKENVDINKAYLIEKKKHDALLNYVLLLANDTA